MALSVNSRVADPATTATSLLIIPVPQAPLPAALSSLPDAARSAIARCHDAGDFTGKRDETSRLYPSADAPIARVLLVGMGRPDQIDAAALRRAAMVGAKAARKLGVPEAVLWYLPEVAPGVSPFDAGQALAEGVPFGAWHFPDLQRPPDDAKPPFERCDIVVSVAAPAFAAGVDVGNAIAAGQTFTRGLQVLPGNTCTPEFIAAQARELAARHKFEITVLDRDGIRKAGMQALLAVSQGSVLEPRFIVLEYRGSNDAPSVLVGKGITFDSGGISIKPAANMEDMKYDMSGAAAVLGTFEAIGRLRPKHHVIGLVPTCENMPSGSSYRPGDVVGSHLGKTIEVVNTDAEGRLILADALSWARQYSPAAVIDCATLTGAVVIALGHVVSGMMGTDDALLDAVRHAGERSGERVWPLPIWDEYREQIKSDIADVKNSGGRPAGSITAGWFLREFAEGYPWVHVDIAGTAYADRESATQVRGPTGVMVRLFTEFVRSRG